MDDCSNSDGLSAVTTPGSQPSQTQTQNSRALAPRPSDGSSGVGSDLAHPGAAGTLSAPKKRVVQASRGVATMTPDRLARKRANDREAQRAVRERTKAQIRELQDEVSVLKNDQAQLQHILQENSALQAENTAMKQAMAQLVHQLDSQSIGQQSSLQHHQHHHEHHQHHHEHHHHHHNHRGSHYRHRDQRISQEYSRSAGKSSTATGESSDQSFHGDNSGESSSSSDYPNCCSPGNSNMVLPSIEEMTRRPFPDASKGPGSSYSRGSLSKHESNMVHQRESFERNSFIDHQPSFQPMDQHHHHQHQHRHKYQHRHQHQHQKPQQYSYSSSPSPSPPYYQALNQETSRFMLSARINLEDLPNMSPSVGDFGKPSVAMIEALENFYGNGNGRHADGSGNGSWNGTGKKYNNDGLNDTNMGNSENGSTENRAVRKGRSLYNSRHIKLPLLHAPSTCEMDSFLLPLLNMSDQCQPTQIEIAALLAPSIVSYNSLRVKLDPFSTALAEIMLLAEPPAGERVPERVAVMYTAFLLIRYMVNATTENFGCVPEFLKPLEDQLERTHAVWIDFIPFPHARIKLIADSSREGVGNDGGNSNGNDGNGNGDEGRTTSDDSSSVRGAEPPRPFFIKYFACLSINWPYQDSDVLLVANGSDAGSRELMINPVFEAHIRKLENWSVSRDFLDTFPEFEHLINLQEN
ncbi:BZIP transcription factor [Ceratocystis lukuohia]|uniref:BZIP transcription factor n=1 Tax=Ceratocystis lukuohia TaxID=2019550 RepID=A0ABR4MRL2_9PEZI